MKHKSPIASLMLALMLVCFGSISLGQATALAGATLATGRISGTVWQDSNNNGVREPQELPLVGYPVYLQRIGEEVIGTMVAVTYTDDEGTFVFDDLEEGKFQVFPEEGAAVVVDVAGIRATTMVDLPIPVQLHQLFLPMAIA